MISEQNQRTGPRASRPVARQRLRKSGISELGVQQLLAGQPLSNATDRKLVALIIGQAASGFGMHFWPRVGDEVIVA